MAQASSASLPLWSSKQSLGVQSPCPASGCIVPEGVIFYPELLPLNVIRPLRFMTSWRIQAYVTSYGVFELFAEMLSGLETHHSPVAVWVGVSKERRTLGSVWCGNRNRNRQCGGEEQECIFNVGAWPFWLVGLCMGLDGVEHAHPHLSLALVTIDLNVGDTSV